MYTVIIPNTVKKDLKRLEKSVIRLIISLLDSLANNPFQGTPLSGDLSDLRKIELQHRRIHYRIAYGIIEERVEIYVFHIGTRENFYSELKRRI